MVEIQHLDVIGINKIKHLIFQDVTFQGWIGSDEVEKNKISQI